MSLRIRETIIIGLIGAIFLAGNVLLIANWLVEKGVTDKANWLRENFLTGTAITVIIALLILLVNPGRSRFWNWPKLTGGKEVYLMYERKSDYSSMGDAKSWSLTETADRYYGHKKSDGCSPSFLSSARWHIQHFMVWLKKQGFDPGQNKNNDRTSVILAGYRQM